MSNLNAKRIADVFGSLLNSNYPESFKYAEITDMKINKQTRELRLSAVCAANFEKADTICDSFEEVVKSALGLEKVFINLSVPEKEEAPAEDPMETLRKMQAEVDEQNKVEKKKAIEEEEEAKPHHIEPGIPLYLETAKLIYGQKIGKMPKKISDVHFDDGRVAVWGDVFGLEIRETRDKRKKIINFNIKDETGAYPVKIFQPVADVKDLCANLKNGMTVIILGDVIYDNYKKEYILEAKAIAKVKKIVRTDDSEEKRVELHMHSNMSMMDAMTDAGKLVERAAQWGHKAVAITDHGVLQGYPAAFQAGQDNGIKVTILLTVTAMFIRIP